MENDHIDQARAAIENARRLLKEALSDPNASYDDLLMARTRIGYEVEYLMSLRDGGYF